MSVRLFGCGATGRAKIAEDADGVAIDVARAPAPRVPAALIG